MIKNKQKIDTGVPNVTNKAASPKRGTIPPETGTICLPVWHMGRDARSYPRI